MMIPPVPQLLLRDASLDLRIAADFCSRARGLLAAPPLRDGEALLIRPCASVHTFAMRYPIDVVFLGRDARVRRVVARLVPWRITACPGSRAALELAAGVAARHGLEPGQLLGGLQPWMN
jgi:uncharacterized membrane protein (UPF0127 family)